MTIATPTVVTRSPRPSLGGRRGARRTPRTGPNPVIKARGLAWLEFDKQDLGRAEVFARDFGLQVHGRTDDTLFLRGARPDTPCDRAQGSGVSLPRHRIPGRRGFRPRPPSLGDGHQRRGPASGRRRTAVRLVDPTGIEVSVVHGAQTVAPSPLQQPLTWNIAGATPRVNATQRPPRAPARSSGSAMVRPAACSAGRWTGI